MELQRAGRFAARLAYPALRGSYQLANAATALAALDVMRDSLAVSMGAVREGLVCVELPGRFQVLPGRPVTVLDVAHNPQAAAALADNLASMGFHPQTWAVFGIMSDKDIDNVIATLLPRVDQWHVADLPPPRGAKATELREPVGARWRRRIAPSGHSRILRQPTLRRAKRPRKLIELLFLAPF